MKKLELYFSDLNEDAQKKYLKFVKCKNSSEFNGDIVPILVLEK